MLNTANNAIAQELRYDPFGKAAAKAIRKCSFAAETPVLMCDGSHKAIKEVRVGDSVLAQHKETGEVACREVESRSANPNQAIILVTLESVDGTTEVIETTDNHPFYVEGRGWTRVDELVPGDLVPSATNGILVVSALEWTDRAEIVYNFGVDEFHTYFVGEVGAWVHNCDPVKRLIRSIHKDSLLVRQAERAGRSVQQSLDNLVGQLKNGNSNPGIGTKHVFGDVHEARAKDGARVYFRNTSDDTLEILGKSSKGNQESVINRLRELYE